MQVTLSQGTVSLGRACVPYNREERSLTCASSVCCLEHRVALVSGGSGGLLQMPLVFGL